MKESGTLDVNISDHLLIYFIRKKNKVKTEKVNFRGRSYRNLVDDELRDKLLDYNWTSFGDNGIDDCWNIMHFRIDAVLNKLCPMKDFKFAKQKPKWTT